MEQNLHTISPVQRECFPSYSMDLTPSISFVHMPAGHQNYALRSRVVTLMDMIWIVILKIR